MNLNFFEERLISFYSSWQNNKKALWGNSDILVMCTPRSETSPNPSHPVSSSFFIWLLGHDIPDTIAVFTRDEIYFICAEERFSILQNLEETAMLAVCVRVQVIVKNQMETGFKRMEKIIQWIRDTEKIWATDADEISPLVIGYICNESPKSDLLLSCAFNLKNNEFVIARVAGFSQLINRHRDKPSAKDIQMRNLPQKVEQILLLTQNKEEKTTEAHKEDLSSDKGATDLSSTAAMYDIADKVSYAEGIAGISSVYV